MPKSRSSSRLLRITNPHRTEIEEAIRTDAFFLKVLVHELRTPLQIIQGVAELMDAGEPLGKLEAHIVAVRREAAWMGAVLNDFSQRRDIGQNGVSLMAGPLDARPVMRELALTMEKYYPGRLELRYPNRLPRIQADPEYLRAILWTLLHNAMRASQVRRGQFVSLAARSTGKKMEFAVSDHGPLISPRYHELIFDPMAQLPRQPRFGLGQGLYVARVLARCMRGDLFVRNPASGRNAKAGHRGNTFVLTLPIVKGGL